MLSAIEAFADGRKVAEGGEQMENFPLENDEEPLDHWGLTRFNSV